MGKVIAKILRDIADSCDENTNNEELLEHLINETKSNKAHMKTMQDDLHDMQCLIGYLGGKINNMSRNTPKSEQCITVPFNK